MVCTANDLSAWKDFPKGLKVLLLDEDSSSAAEIKSKLESMDYIVFTFCDEKEALSAISKKPESFHVSIVEVSTNNTSGCFKFLENAKDLPTIMTSNIHCLSTMMKCIALGAVEFLQKPLSEDKLRNIWQHVVHKAFNAGGTVFSESLKPVKNSVISMLQVKVETEQIEEKKLQEAQNLCSMHERELELSPASDKYPAPSTPQLNRGRLVDDADCQENTNCSTEKDCGEQDGESKSVETTSGMDEVTLVEACPERRGGAVIKMEDDSTVHVNSDNNICLKHENAVSPRPKSKDHLNNFNDVAEIPNKSCTPQNSFGTKSSRKKMKVDWTPDLHKKFVQAVEQLGADQAIPSRILELMKVEGLTRHNVASHLQKYRMHKRHILPKEDDRRLAHQRDQVHRSYCPHKPIIAYPPYHSNHTVPPSSVYPMWGATGGQAAGVHMWASPGYQQWPLGYGWHWKPYAGMHADAWGCPVMPPPYNAYSSSPPNASGIHSPVMVDNTCSVPQKSFDQQPAEEIIDKVVKEAISKPWLPLPLGLKPPSTDSVLAELSRKGICPIPSQINSANSV